MKKYFWILVLFLVITFIWFYILTNLKPSNSSVIASCQQQTYFGPSFPDLLNFGGRNRCGNPISPMEFLLEFALLLLPGTFVSVLTIGAMLLWRRFKTER